LTSLPKQSYSSNEQFFLDHPAQRSVAEGAITMSPNLSLVCDNKKFMWDGCFYATRDEASQVKEAYASDNFEVNVTEEEGKFLVYTRRVVKEAVTAPQ
jgi:hypothetical protein